MSAYINSFLIEPVVRQARRFSYSPDDQPLPHQHHPAGSPLAHTHYPPQATSSSEELANTNFTIPDGATEEARALRVQYSSVAPIPGHAASTTLPTAMSITTEIPATTHDSDWGRPPPNFVLDRPPVRSPSPTGDSNRSNDYHLQEAATLDSLRSMSLDQPPSMSSNPSVRRFPTHDGATSSRHGTGPPAHVDTSSEPRSREESPHSTMSGHLPADDGMKSLREKIHQIREMALSSEEKAARMHTLMTADYKTFKALQRMPPSPELLRGQRRSTQRSTSVSSESRAAYEKSLSSPTVTTRAHALELYGVNEEDQQPSYRPPSPPAEDDQGASRRQSESSDDGFVLGCAHYKRNVKVQCPECRGWYPCRHCHDEVEDHRLVRKNIQNMLCMLCGTPQPAAEYCSKCEEQASLYYCDICKLWDNDARSRIYHCPDCGICRKGEGLGKDYVHCKKCNVCISIKWATSHRCVERATECDCPICGEYMFTSSSSVVAMKCGHYIHRSCYDSFMQTAYKCPICSRSAVNMELQWRKLDRAIEAQPMPEQWEHAKASVVCNDCSGKSWTGYHWLGSKCGHCDSYNTQLIKILQNPAEGQASNESDSSQHLDSPTPHNLMDAPPQAAMIGDRAHSPLPDAIAASVDVEPTVNIHESGVALDPHNLAAPHSPANTSITAVGSPPHPRTISSPEVQMANLDSDNHAGDSDEEREETSFWGEPISPSGFLSRMSSPVNWGSPGIFGSNTSPRRREAEDDDIDDAEIIEGNGEGVFGWGLSPGAWAISPPAFFTYRFGARGPPAEQGERDHDSDAEGGEESADDSDSDRSGVEGDGEVDEDVEMDELELPGHR